MPVEAERCLEKPAHLGHGFPSHRFPIFSGSTLQRPGAFASKAATPPQSPRPEPFLDLVGHGVHPALLLPLLAVEEHALGQARVVHAADAHAHQPDWQVFGRKPMAQKLVGRPC